jgi:hypothetical protein
MTIPQLTTKQAGRRGGKSFVAIVRQFTVTADSLGSIKLLFTGVVGNALLSGFEIVPA